MSSSAGKRIRSRPRTWDEETKATEIRSNTNTEERNNACIREHADRIVSAPVFICMNSLCDPERKPQDFKIGILHIGTNWIGQYGHRVRICIYCNHYEPDPVTLGKCKRCSNQRYRFIEEHDDLGSRTDIVCVFCRMKPEWKYCQF